LSYRKLSLVGRLLAALAALMSLIAVLPAAAAASTPTLKYGQKGNEVKILQKDLTAVGYRTSVTGLFNHATKSSVVHFQRTERLSTDGVVGPRTWSAMNHVLKAKTNTSDVTANSPTTVPADDVSGGAGILPTPAATTAPSTGTSTTTTATATSSSTGPAGQATINSQGLAVAPANAPQIVQEVIASANKIASEPYVYGGGHNGWGPQSGYDCSGSVSYALHGAGLLASPLDSTQFESWGASGAGQWITIYADSGHAYMNVAGLWFDTAAQSASNGNDRWSAKRISPASGFTVVHPVGW
jgi:peptidoglycan hydrolase-like protein with peptidoglycan-binding domain